jgi:hypothetical protein
MVHKTNLQSVPERGNIGRRAVLGALAAGSIGGSMAGLAPVPTAASAAGEINQTGAERATASPKKSEPSTA